MESFKERLEHILRSKNLAASQFAEIMGIQPSNVSHLLNGRNNPSYDFLVKLKEVFPEYNFDWILLGKKPITSVESYVTNNVETVAKVATVKDEKQLEVDFLLDDSPATVTEKVDNQQNNNNISCKDDPNNDVIDKEIAHKSSICSSEPKKIILMYDDGSFEVLHSRK